MKKLTFAIAALLGLLLVGAVGSAQAQQSIRVNIPFAFMADKAALPAGEYLVQRPAIGGPRVLMLQRVDGSAAAIVPAMSVQANDWQTETYLVFHRFGDSYFLSQIWTEGNKSGLQLYKSPREKELARNETPGEVTLLARLSAPKH